MLLCNICGNNYFGIFFSILLSKFSYPHLTMMSARKMTISKKGVHKKTLNTALIACKKSSLNWANRKTCHSVVFIINFEETGNIFPLSLTINIIWLLKIQSSRHFLHLPSCNIPRCELLLHTYGFLSVFLWANKNK